MRALLGVSMAEHGQMGRITNGYVGIEVAGDWLRGLSRHQPRPTGLRPWVWGIIGTL